MQYLVAHKGRRYILQRAAKSLHQCALHGRSSLGQLLRYRIAPVVWSHEPQPRQDEARDPYFGSGGLRVPGRGLASLGASPDAPTVDTTADGLLADLARVADQRGIAVTFQAQPGTRYGVSKQGSVEVDNQHATGQQAKTLAHELAHEALHWEDRGPLTRSIAELEAESVAYVVCTHFGLDVEVRASRYIVLWDGDSKALRSSLERIADTARSIIDDVEALDARKAVA